MRRGGTAFVIDNDATRSTFGAWFRRGYPTSSTRRGAVLVRARLVADPLDITWEFDSREDFEAVVRIEFDRGHRGLDRRRAPGHPVDYAVNLWWRQF